ncbi:NADP-dependent oxidoreductase [Agromyces salentinus]|uniref:NADP-dependent oxidoreductase n=1 Tax=Agromyces salentinus TaxID=269421 RepID=A0ABN2MTS0_9MICO|nr:NADP-dependent oxidoreductase [Agromyces salentinus]
MAHEVRFATFGGPEVLEIAEIPTPEPGPGEVLVEVYAAGLNPVESAVRRGEHPERWHVEPPASQGRDLAGLVIATGPGVVRLGRGDEVMGFVDRGAQATHVVVPEANLLERPSALSWEVAGSLYTAGTTAWSIVEGLHLGPNDTVVITAAAGGVGCLAAQLARLRGAAVIGTAPDMRFDFLRQFGVIPLPYGPDLADRVREVAPHPANVFLDFLGEQAEEARALGIPPSRVFTLTDWDAIERDEAVRAGAGDIVALGRIAALVSARRLRLPIADVFPLEKVADAYRALERREAPGKIVLGMRVVDYPMQKSREPELKEQDVTIGVPTEHDRLDVEEAVPAAVGDGSVRRRRREAREHGVEQTSGEDGPGLHPTML